MLRRTLTLASGDSQPPILEQALPIPDRAPTDPQPASQEPLPPVPPQEPSRPEDLIPGEPPPVERLCRRVPGDCSIYSDLFWELLAAYERFEIGLGTYPYHPRCLEAWEQNQPMFCAAVLVFLYPDGTLGMAHWVIDPESPSGWSRCVFDQDMNGPAACM